MALEGKPFIRASAPILQVQLFSGFPSSAIPVPVRQEDVGEEGVIHGKNEVGRTARHQPSGL